MKLKNGEIFYAAQPLRRLIGEKFPLKTSYELATLVNKLANQLAIIEDVRQGLLRKYGDKNPQGQYAITLDSENWDKFGEEINELFDQEVEVELERVKLPDNTNSPIEIEPSVLMALERFIEM